MQDFKRKRRGERIRSVFASLCFVSFFVQHGESGVCLNVEFEATDSNGYRCSDGDYDYGFDCGYYDDVDFTANLMCCGCGGGERERNTQTRKRKRERERERERRKHKKRNLRGFFSLSLLPPPKKFKKIQKFKKKRYEMASRSVRVRSLVLL